MSLEEFHQLEARKGPECWHASIAKKIDAKECASLEEALAHPTLQTKAIWRWMQNRGITIAPTSIARHRRKECGCFNV